MLTKDLIRARVRGPEISPSLIDPKKKGYREASEALVGLYAQAATEGWTRARLERTIQDWIGDRRDHKVVRGLAKLCTDRSTFAVKSPMPPMQLRLEVFRAARAAGPLALEAGPFERPTAEQVLDEVGQRLGISGAEVRDALYADLEEHQRVEKSGISCPKELLDRYNMALVQALLLRATRLTLSLGAPRPERTRQLLRWVKFHQLIWSATRSDDGGLIVHVDGPTSLFGQSTRYGLQLATFFPMILLQPEPWTVEAQVLWTKARHRKTLLLDHTAGLVCHRSDTGGYRTRHHAWFEERWAARETPWELTEATEPLHLGARDTVMPDYRFTHPDGRVAHLELVGFWKRERLERYLDLLRRLGPPNLLVAVSKQLKTDKKGDLPEQVLGFAKILPAAKVEAWLEAHASVPPPPSR